MTKPDRYLQKRGHSWYYYRRVPAKFAAFDDRGTIPVIADAQAAYPTLAVLFADGGYAGDKLHAAMLRIDGLTLEIVRRSDRAKGFVVIARRWVVERTLAWLGRCRRLAKDWKKTIASSEAWMIIASIRRTSRHVAKAMADY